MSRRPQATRSRPQGSTGAAGAKTRAAKIARGKRHDLSPYPRSAVGGKHIIKQGFPETRNASR